MRVLEGGLPDDEVGGGKGESRCERWKLVIGGMMRFFFFLAYCPCLLCTNGDAREDEEKANEDNE